MFWNDYKDNVNFMYFYNVFLICILCVTKKRLKENKPKRKFNEKTTLHGGVNKGMRV